MSFTITICINIAHSLHSPTLIEMVFSVKYPAMVTCTYGVHVHFWETRVVSVQHLIWEEISQKIPANCFCICDVINHGEQIRKIEKKRANKVNKNEHVGMSAHNILLDMKKLKSSEHIPKRMKRA